MASKETRQEASKAFLEELSKRTGITDPSELRDLYRTARGNSSKDIFYSMNDTVLGTKMTYGDLINLKNEIKSKYGVGSLADYNNLPNLDSFYNKLSSDEIELDAAGTESDSGLDEYQKYIDDMLMIDTESRAAQRYKADMYSAISGAESANNATLAAAELDAYRILGQQQLELENQIANQRAQAIKSGVTSAQLASQELANMFAAQTGAAQVAQGVLDQRIANAQNYNTQRLGVTSNLYDLINNNQATAANIYAQLGAAQASYNSYIQQPYAQYDALMQAYRKYGDDLIKAQGLESTK